MKKILLCLSLFLCLSIQNSYAKPSQISQIDKYIIVKNGQFSITKKGQPIIKKLIGKQNYKSLTVILNQYNALVRLKKLMITKNKTIIDKDKSLTVQGGNINKQKLYWWGVRNYMSHSKAKEYIKDLKSIKSKSSTKGLFVSVLGGFVGLVSTTTMKIAGKLLSFFTGGISLYIGNLEKKVSKVYKKLHKNTGLVVEFTAWFTTDCYAQ